MTFDEHLNPSLLLVDGTTLPIANAADSVLAMVKGTVNVVRQIQHSPSRKFCKPSRTAHAVAETGEAANTKKPDEWTGVDVVMFKTIRRQHVRHDR